ncbi:MAG: hypothetical protein E7559_04365 [Ruminococcaceae bacterium]|nr:hypothetical protein [Oscillospiraceae bacterium]
MQLTRCFFIINPAAGIKNAYESIGDTLKSACEQVGIPFEYRLTEYPGHAQEIAAEIAGQATEEKPIRIFSVGGDGTLFEVVNGIVGKPFCELGCIPCGTGNDYIKCYGDRSEFLDIAGYITSEAVPADCIKAGDVVSINICSLGLDAKICDRANFLKSKHKNMPGSKAYDKALVQCFLGKLYNDLKVTIDDDQVYEGKYLFALAASGKCYGGGYNSAPMAEPADGLLDFILVKSISHPRVLTMIGPYKSGKYFGMRRFRKIVVHARGKKMRVEAKTPAIINVDGECSRISDLTIEVMPAAVRFVVPQSYLKK